MSSPNEISPSQSRAELDELEQGFFRNERVHRSIAGLDLFLDIGEAVAVGRDHFCNAVGDDEFGTRERKPRLCSFVIAKAVFWMK